jgi:prephenate dehydratase
MDFLKKVSSIKLVEDKDTAETARKFRKKTVKRVAAVLVKQLLRCMV